MADALECLSCCLKSVDTLHGLTCYICDAACSKTADHVANVALVFHRETEYLLENMQASVKDSAASSRQELEQLQQKVKHTLHVVTVGCSCAAKTVI